MTIRLGAFLVCLVGCGTAPVQAVDPQPGSDVALNGDAEGSAQLEDDLPDTREPDAQDSEEPLDGDTGTSLDVEFDADELSDANLDLEADDAQAIDAVEEAAPDTGPDDTEGPRDQLTGSLTYEDKTYGAQGFDGTTASLPARYVEIEIRDAAGVAVSSGRTDDAGNFSIPLDLSAASDFRLVVLASAQIGETVVQVRSASRRRTLYEFVSDARLFPSAGPLRVAVGGEAAMAGALNMIDVSARAVEHIAALSDRTLPSFTFRWEPGEPWSCGSCYNNNEIQLGGQTEDPDEFDDDIILHEIGHHFVRHLSADSSPGGTHRDRIVAPTLAYGEGLAYFFAAWVNDNPIVVDNYAGSFRVWDFEAVTLGGRVEDAFFNTSNGALTGNLREEIVAAVLWDMIDRDTTPEEFDTLSISDQQMFNILEAFNFELPAGDSGVAGIDMVDFLNAAICKFDVDRFALKALAISRGYPWPEDGWVCPRD